ncbi:MAG: serine/threonine protein kinase [Candidatus Brocadiaceae bacterium]|nr:serine/threonine protein kinase [Candidatus Brocadiaceae bacterium]
MPEKKPRRFAGYHLRRILGHGSMGVVYLADHEATNTPAAVKVLSSALGRDHSYAHRFLTEARLATQLDHPNIVRVHDYGVDGGHYFMAMEYVDGRNCRARIAEDGAMDWREAVAVAAEVAEGLRAAALKGIIHRDIKPENIVIDSSGHVRITDLGLAKELDVLEPAPNDTSLGTPDYMSPEQVNNSELVDQRSDIYSLGATLFHMICGRAPYTGRSAYEVMVKHVSATLPSPTKYVPDLPREVCDVMRKMMARDPADRYQDYDVLIADLRALLSGGRVAASSFDDDSLLGRNGSSQNGAACARPSRRGVWVAAAVLPVLGAIGTIIYFILNMD